MLGVRVIEVGALDQIEKTSKTGEFLKAAGAPAARPVQAGANIVLHPVETVKGGPAAVGRFFDRVQLGARHIAGGTKGEGTTAEKRLQSGQCSRVPRQPVEGNSLQLERISPTATGGVG